MKCYYYKYSQLDMVRVLRDGGSTRNKVVIVEPTLSIKTLKISKKTNMKIMKLKM